MGRYYVKFKNAVGRWERKASTAGTKAAAKKLADELEIRAERQRLGLEPTPDPDGGGPWTELVEWYGREYASVQPNFRRWTSLKNVHLVQPPLLGDASVT
jgi:integrase